MREGKSEHSDPSDTNACIWYLTDGYVNAPASSEKRSFFEPFADAMLNSDFEFLEKEFVF